MEGAERVTTRLRLATGGGEDKRIGTDATQVSFRLADTVLAQLTPERRQQLDGRGAGAALDGHARPGWSQLPADSERSPLEVDVAPAKTKNLRDAQSRKRADRDDWPERVGEVAQQTRDLPSGQVAGFGQPRPSRAVVAVEVADDDTFEHAHFQPVPEEAGEDADRAGDGRRREPSQTEPVDQPAHLSGTNLRDWARAKDRDDVPVEPLPVERDSAGGVATLRVAMSDARLEVGDPVGGELADG